MLKIYKPTIYVIAITIILLLGACSPASYTVMESSFHTTTPADSMNQKTIFINDDINKLDLNATLKVDCGSVIIEVIDLSTDEVIWSEDYVKDSMFKIELVDLKAEAQYSLNIKATQSKTVKLTITSKEKLVETEDKPDKDEISGGTALPSTEESQPPAIELESIENELEFSTISNLEFMFSSGVGGWFTALVVHDDGTFEGEYHDSDMGDVGDSYPNGILYLCNFTGKLTTPKKVNDYTYSVKIEQMELAEEPDTEEIKDGIRYIYREPYGLDDAEELLIYTPDTPVQDLPEEYLSWVLGYSGFTDTQLPFYGLYNVNTGEGFSSYEKRSLEEEN